MALVVNDRVKETSTTTGTGTLTLDGAVTGFETFSSAIGNSNTTYYAIELPNTAEFEVGRGTVSAGQLARTEVISSSNSDNPVNFSAGTKNVFCTLPASKAVIEDASNNVTLPADLTVDTDTLYVDSTNDRVGIGTTSPARDTLHVHSTVAPGTYVHLTNSSTGSAASDGSSIFVDTSGNFEINNRESASIRLKTGSLVAQTITTSGTVINEDGASVDFRVEGDNDANLFFVDGSTDRIGIGTSSPGTALHMRIDGGDANLLLERSTAGVTSKWGIKPYNDKLHFRDESASPIIDNFTMTSDGYFGIGTANPSTLLHLSSSDPQITITDTDGTGSQVIKAVGNNLELVSANQTVLNSASTIFLDSNNGLVAYNVGATEYMRVSKSTNSAVIKSSISDGDLILKGNDGGSEISALTLDMSEAGDATFSSNIFLGDNKKANFGASNDLQIFHNGNNSVILDNGTGSLSLQSNGTYVGLYDASNANHMVLANTGAGVNLYHNGSQKLTTTASGINVTGTVVTDGLTVGGYTFPTSDGTANQILETDGSGTLTFVDKPAAGVSAGFAVAMAIAL